MRKPMDSRASGGEPGSPTHRKVHGLRVVVRGIVILMVTVLSGLAVFFWIRSERAATRQFNRSHLTVARLGAKRLEQIVQTFERSLEVLARSGCDCASVPAQRLRTDVEALDDLAPLGAREIFRVDGKGGVVTTTAFEPDVIRPMSDKVSRECAGGATDAVCIVDEAGTGKIASMGHSLVMMAPLARCAGEGHVGLVISWERLGRLIGEETALSNLDLGWIMAEDGTLLFHPQHPEMSHRSVRSGDTSCAECHVDFAIAERMLQGTEGVDEVDVRGSTRKLVAYAPVAVAGTRWSLAISAPYRTVVGENRSALVVAILVSAFLIGLFLLVTYYLDRENRRYIDELHESQETISGLNADLETKVIERTHELEVLYAEMREIQGKFDATQRLAIVGELASMVAHEIRTPLNSLAIGSQRLLRSLRRGNELDLDQVERIVESQQYEVERINGYIEEYLKFSRLPRRSAQPTDLGLLIENIVRFFALEAARSGVALHVETDGLPAIARVDEEQIRQVLLNLLLNAIQAMPEGGDIFLGTDVLDTEVRVTVRDTGAGIAEEHMDSVFKPFFTTREEGTGLGLAISARIVEENGGTIECSSEQGHGTTFRIRLPSEQGDEPS